MAVRPEMKEIMQNRKHRVLTVEVNPPGLVGAGRLGDKSKTEVNFIFTLRSKTLNIAANFQSSQELKKTLQGLCSGL